MAVAALSVASLVSDAVPDDVVSLLSGGGLVVWFGAELRGQPEREDRRLLMVGIIAGGLLFIAAVVGLVG